MDSFEKKKIGLVEGRREERTTRMNDERRKGGERERGGKNVKSASSSSCEGRSPLSHSLHPLSSLVACFFTAHLFRSLIPFFFTCSLAILTLFSIRTLSYTHIYIYIYGPLFSSVYDPDLTTPRTCIESTTHTHTPFCLLFVSLFLRRQLRRQDHTPYCMMVLLKHGRSHFLRQRLPTSTSTSFSCDGV